MEIGQVRGNSILSPAAKGPKAASGRDAERIRSDQALPDRLDIRAAARDAQAVQQLAEQSLLDGDGERARQLHEVKTRLLSGELDRPEVFLRTAQILLSAGSEGFLESQVP